MLPLQSTSVRPCVWILFSLSFCLILLDLVTVPPPIVAVVFIFLLDPSAISLVFPLSWSAQPAMCSASLVTGRAGRATLLKGGGGGCFLCLPLGTRDTFVNQYLDGSSSGTAMLTTIRTYLIQQANPPFLPFLYKTPEIEQGSTVQVSASLAGKADSIHNLSRQPVQGLHHPLSEKLTPDI